MCIGKGLGFSPQKTYDILYLNSIESNLFYLTIVVIACVTDDTLEDSGETISNEEIASSGEFEKIRCCENFILFPP